MRTIDAEELMKWLDADGFCANRELYNNTVSGAINSIKAHLREQMATSLDPDLIAKLKKGIPVPVKHPENLFRQTARDAERERRGKRIEAEFSCIRRNMKEESNMALTEKVFTLEARVKLLEGFEDRQSFLNDSFMPVDRIKYRSDTDELRDRMDTLMMRLDEHLGGPVKHAHWNVDEVGVVAPPLTANDPGSTFDPTRDTPPLLRSSDDEHVFKFEKNGSYSFGDWILDNGTWHHVVLVSYDGTVDGKKEVYFDGVQHKFFDPKASPQGVDFSIALQYLKAGRNVRLGSDTFVMTETGGVVSVDLHSYFPIGWEALMSNEWRVVPEPEPKTQQP